MDAEIQAVKDAAAKLGEVIKTSRVNVETAVADLKTKKDAAHKIIDDTYNDLINAAVRDVIPTNTK